MDNLSGKLIKGYHLQKKLGEGGFGSVYQAQQTSVGRDVAVKIIRPKFANQPAFIRRFENEAHTIANLEHMHITPLYDYWRDPEGAYLVMRFLKGGSLRDAIQDDGPYNLSSANLLLQQVANALDLAHTRQIVHRDIKPENILLDEDGNAYLADFGIAKDLNLNKGPTVADEIVGSLDYISPEQARSEPVTPRTDVYSLGVVMYEVLTGTHPWPDLTSVERLYKHINDPLPEITGLENIDLGAVNDVIQKATAKDPNKRYDTPIAFAEAFQKHTIGSDPVSESIVAQLTQREHEVLQGIIAGKSNKQIASDLFIEVSTVKWYIRQIYGKLGVRSRVQAIVKARDLQLVGSAKRIDETDSPFSTSYLAEVENPYKGLRAFSSADALDFFGREKLVNKLVRRLEVERFLAVIGPSGSGKSSAVKAGLIPAIWRGDIIGSDSWYVVDMLPGKHPLDQLEVALTRVAADQSTNMNTHLTRDDRGLLRCADLILPDDGSELVVVVDQFEEVFTLVEDEQQRQHFLDLIRTATTEARSRVRVVLTLRADFYDRPLRYPAFGALLRANMETILPLSAQELEQAIVQPAKRVGIVFEPGLVATMVGEMNYQAGALPLLQYALTELFDRREGRQIRHETYNDIGGAVGALARRAEQTYSEMNDAGQAATRQMFLRLVTLGEGVEDTRRRTPRAELLVIADDTDLMEEIIDVFAGYRLLSLDNDPQTRAPTVEVAHEAILREWERLRTWLDESRADIRLENVLSAATDDWLNNQRDESYLLRGARLEQFSSWIDATDVSLTPEEREFVSVSRQHHEREITLEEQREATKVAQDVRLRRLLIILVGVLGVLFMGAVAFSFFALDREQRTSNALATAEYAEARNLELALINSARAAFAEEDLDTALALAIEANAADEPQPAAQAILADAAYTPGTKLVFETQTSSWNIRINPDHNLLLSIPSFDYEKALWNLENGELIQRYDAERDDVLPVSSGDINPDGQTVAYGSVVGDITIYDAYTGEPVSYLQADLSDSVVDMQYLPDGERLLASYVTIQADGTCTGDLLLWDVTTGDIIHDFDGRSQCQAYITLTDDGQTAIVGGSLNSTVYPADPGLITFWDLETGTEIKTLGLEGEGHAGVVVSTAITPDGSRLASLGQGFELIFWDLETDEIITRIEEASGNFTNTFITISPDGQTLSINRNLLDEQIIFYDMNTYSKKGSFNAGFRAATRTVFLPDSRYIIVSGDDGPIRMIDLQYGPEVARVQLNFPEAMHEWPLRFTTREHGGSFAIHTTTRAMWMAEDMVVPIHHAIFDLRSGELLSHFVWDDVADATSTAIINTEQAVTALTDGTLIIWDIETGEEIRRMDGPAPQLQVAHFNNQLVLLPAIDDRGPGTLVYVMDLESGSYVTFGQENLSIIDWQLSADGTVMVTSTRQGEITVWDAETGEILQQLDIHPEGIVSIIGDIDAQSERALSYGAGELVLWELATGDVINRYTVGPSDYLTPAQFTSEGILFIGEEVRLIEPESGAVLRTYAPEGSLRFNLLTSDSQILLTVGSNPMAIDHIWWRLDTQEALVDWMQANRYVRDLSCEERTLYQIKPLCETD